ncbi:MAG: MFS transporter [Proteobacteria bacterium]|nr:MFS transporter [Pseudomonadota bacterium]
MLSTKQEFQRGWRTLLACSIGNGFGLSGFAFYTFGVFVIPLVDAFGWTRGEVSTAASFLLLGTVFTAPIVGTIVDRYGAKRVGLISMACLCVGYASLTQLGGGIAFFYAMWLMMAIVGGGTTPVVWTRAVNLWFDKGRGLALGLALAGSGLAGIVGPGVATALIESFGWQAGYLGISAIIMVIALPLIALLFNDHAPSAAQAKQSDDSVVQASTTGHQSGHAGLTFQESYKTVVFWKIAIGFFFISAIIAGLLINLIPLLIDRDMSAMDAAKIAGVLGFAVLFGRIGVGFLIDHFRAPLVAALLFSATAAGCFLLTLDSAPSWVFLIAVITLGLSAAAEIDLVAFLVSRFFGLKAYGKIYGSQLSVFYLGAAVGPLAVGMSFDIFGSYEVALYGAIVILLFGSIVIGGLGKPRNFSE